MRVEISKTKASTSKDNSRCINYVLAYLVVQAINYFIKLVIGDIPYWSVVSKGVLAIFMLFSLFAAVKRKLLLLLSVELIVALCFGYTLLIGDHASIDIKTIYFNAAVVFLPLSFSVACIQDYGVFLRRLYVVSWPITLLLIITSLKQAANNSDYNMPLSYALMLQALILIDHYLEGRRWYDLIMSGIIIAFIVVGGSRGPLLCIAVYIVLLISNSKVISTANKIIYIVSIILVGGIFLLNMDAIILWMIKQLEARGIASRSLNFLYNRNFTVTERDTIYGLYINKMAKGPVFGYGLAGGWVDAHYPHNIIIELLLSFGYYLGTVVSVVYIWTIIRGLSIRNKRKHRLALILIAYGVKLLISNSFILEPIFFLTIPVCLSESHIKFRNGDNVRHGKIYLYTSDLG